MTQRIEPSFGYVIFMIFLLSVWYAPVVPSVLVIANDPSRKHERSVAAACCHMGDTYRRREWSHVTGVVFFPCCGRTVSSSSLRLVDVVCLPAGNAIDQPRNDVEEVDPNFMLATLIAFPETQRVVGNGECTMIANLPVACVARWS